MSLFDTLLGDFAGNFVVLGIIAVFILIALLLVLAVSKIMFLAIILVALYALGDAGLVPMWIFGLSLVPTGIFIGKMILDSFFSSR